MSKDTGGNTKLHYYMGSLSLFIVAEEEQTKADINVLIPSTEMYCNKRMIDRMQMEAQVQLAKLNNDNLPVINNIHVNSISYLGEMTDEEMFGASNDK